MNITGLLMDAADIVVGSRTNRTTGEVEKTATLKLMTSKPTAVIDVKLTPEQIKSGAIELCAKSVGKQMEWQVEYRQMAFGNDKGQHVELKGFQLFTVPELK